MADYLPYRFRDRIPHYHGDTVRQLFIAAAALMLIGAPFYSDSLRGELPFEIVGALVVIVIAALVNPHKRSICIAAAVVAGVGLVVFETWALYGYRDSTLLQFILREVIAVIFLAGFYFSMKTVRAFVLGKIGRHDEAGEFDRQISPTIPATPATKARASPWRDEFLPWFLRTGSSDQEGGAGVGQGEVEETGPRMSPGRPIEDIKPKNHPYEDPM